MKPRWVFVFFAISLLLIYNNPSSAETPSPSDLETQIHFLINNKRSEVVPNYPVLRLHSTLIEVARAHSKDMFEKGYFDHVNQEGLDPFERLSAAGVSFDSAAENLFFAEGYNKNDIANLAVQGWIKSDGHYRNMIGFYSFTGIGVYSAGDMYYVTQLFVQASEITMRSNGVIYDNDNLEETSNKPSFLEVYQQEIFLGSLVLIIIFLGKRAESLNRQGWRR